MDDGGGEGLDDRDFGESWPSEEARAALDGMSDRFVALDRSFRVRFVNRAFAESRPDGAPTLLGRSLWEIWPEMRGSVVEASLARAFELQLPVAFEYHHERSGRWLSATAHPHGELIHVFFRDVTQERRNESERAEREARLQAMLDSMPQIAWSTDARMVTTHLNRRWREYTGRRAPLPRRWPPSCIPTIFQRSSAWASAPSRSAKVSKARRGFAAPTGGTGCTWCGWRR